MLPWWGQLLVGLAAVGGCAVAIVRGLWQIDTAAHNRMTCKCEDCKTWRWKRDLRAEVRRKQQALKPMKALGPDGSVHDLVGLAKHPEWVSTARLDVGMRVSLDGHPYKVVGLKTDRMGYLVEIVNLATKDRFIVTVKFSMADFKYWEPLP